MLREANYRYIGHQDRSRWRDCKILNQTVIADVVTFIRRLVQSYQFICKSLQ